MKWIGRFPDYSPQNNLSAAKSHVSRDCESSSYRKAGDRLDDESKWRKLRQQDYCLPLDRDCGQFTVFSYSCLRDTSRKNSMLRVGEGSSVGFGDGIAIGDSKLLLPLAPANKVNENCFQPIR